MPKPYRNHSVLFALIFLYILFGCSSGKKEEPESLAILEQEIHKGRPPKEGFQKTESPSVPSSWSLLDLIQGALRQNPGIRSARYHWEKMIEKYPQMISLPDPSLTYSYPLRHADTRSDMEKHRIVLMQEIPFPVKLYYQGEVAKAEAHLGRLSYEKTVRDTVADVQMNFYEVAYFEAALQITRKNKEILQIFVQAAQVETATGKTPISDLLRAQSQLAQMDYDIVRLEELKRTALGQIQALIARNQRDEIMVEKLAFPGIKPMPDFGAIYDYALKNRQEIRAAAIGIEKGDKEVSLALSEYFPDLSIGFQWSEVEGEGMDTGKKNDDEWMLMFGVTVPLWIPKKEAKVKESRLSLQNLIETKKDLENQLGASLKKAYYQALNAHRLVKLYEETLLPQAHQAIAIAERWYRNQEGSLLALLDAQSVLLNFSLAAARAHADYAQSMIEIAKLCGGTLPAELFASPISPADQK